MHDDPPEGTYQYIPGVDFDPDDRIAVEAAQIASARQLDPDHQ